MVNFKNVVNKAKGLSATALFLAMSNSAMAQVGNKNFTSTVGDVTCAVLSTSGPIVPFVAGIAIVIFFVLIALNEGNQMITHALKIMIGVSGLVGVGWIMNTLFGLKSFCANAGSTLSSIVA